MTDSKVGDHKSICIPFTSKHPTTRARGKRRLAARLALALIAVRTSSFPIDASPAHGLCNGEHGVEAAEAHAVWAMEMRSC